MAIKKILLQKMVSGALTDLYPKTDASIVAYTRVEGTGVDQTNTLTTVEAELAALLAKFANYSTTTEMETAIATAKSQILGSSELDATLDTIKELQDWIKANGADATNLLSRLVTLEGYVGKAASGGDTATGLFLAVDGINADLGSAYTAGQSTVKGHIADLEADVGASYATAATPVTVKNHIANLEADVGSAYTAGDLTVKGHIKDLENDVDALETALGAASTSGANPTAATGLFAQVETLEGYVGVPAAGQQAATGLFLAVDQLNERANAAFTFVASTDTAPTTATADESILYAVEIA